MIFAFFFFNDTATTEIYTLSLHDALPIWAKFPTGGIWICLSACVQQPASARQAARPAGVSRSGEMPEPTVTVRMKEIAQHLHGRRHSHGCPMGCAAPCGAMARALIHLSHLERAP